MGKKLNYFTAIKFLSKYIRRHKKNFLMFYFGWLLDTVLAIAMPILFGIMTDEIIYQQNLNVFVQIALVFVTLTVLSCLLYFFIYAQHSYLMNMYTYDIQKDIFSHIQNADAQYLSNASAGDLVATTWYYSAECMHFVIRNIIHITHGIFQIIAISAYLFVINWQIGLFVLLAAPIAVFINAKFGKKIRKYGNREREYYGGYIGWVFELLSSFRDLRMLGAQKRVNKFFKEKHNEMFSVNIKSGISSLTAQNIISFTNLIIQLGIFTLCGYLAISGGMTVGLLIIIVAFYGMLTYRIGMVSGSYLDSQNRVSFIQRIYDFLQSPSETEWPGDKELVITNGDVQFKNICFAYDGGNTVLDNFDLKIASGERFALVGKSGCGKTTLAYMLIGFYLPQSGHIEIDGQKLTDCSLKSIRQNIGLIQQDVLLFSGTIKENILLGNFKATDEQIESACKSAGLWDFIESLPDKLDTKIGDNGTGLSGGQKQRVAIARIYLKNPKIIIFDEATSSLDKETEESIHNSWREMLAGRTAIIIAHRQSSVMLCEKAALLENGSVAEIGVPNEMAANNDKFKTLFAIKEGKTNA